MGQSWKLVNIDRWAVLTRYDSGLKLDSVVADRSLDQLLGMIRRHKLVDFKYDQERLLKSKGSSSSRLTALPQEIIDQVVASLLIDEYDLNVIQGTMHLALSCSYFFRLMARHFQRRITSGPWAGDRLIFVGSYAKGYPEGIASDVEKKQWEATNRTENHWNPFYIQGKPGMQGELQGEKLGKMESEADCSPNLVLKPFYIHDDSDYRRSEFLVQLLTREQEVVDEGLNCPILRNLTAKKYVRDQVIEENLPGYSLGHIVIGLSLWTNNSSGTIGLGTHGEWAGHRFDIATMADIDMNWEDASGVALEKLIILDDYMGLGQDATGSRRA